MIGLEPLVLQQHVENGLAARVADGVDEVGLPLAQGGVNVVALLQPQRAEVERADEGLGQHRGQAGTRQLRLTERAAGEASWGLLLTAELYAAGTTSSRATARWS